MCPCCGCGDRQARGFAVAYEMAPGNIAEKTPLRDRLATIKRRYRQAARIWFMDRGHAPWPGNDNCPPWA